MDVIVVGGGLGGLTAGALLAREGKQVLLLEAHSKLGGAATVFGRKELKIEVGLHELDGMSDPSDPKVRLFRALGLPISTVPIPEFYAVHAAAFGEHPFVMPEGYEGAERAVLERFPRSKDCIQHWFSSIRKVQSALTALSALEQGGLWIRAKAVTAHLADLAFLVRHERTTVGEMLAPCAEPALDLALAANLGYYSHHLGGSFLYFAAGQGGYLRGGSHYIRGGSQVLSDALAAAIREAGGDARTRSEVVALLMEGGRVSGVRYREGGQEHEVHAPVVLGNASPHALAAMLPEEAAARFRAPWEALRPSTSAWSVYLGFSEVPAVPGHYSTFYFPDWMPTLANYQEGRALMGADPGARLPPYVAVNYSRIDHGLPFRGQHLVVLTGTDALEPWASLSEEAYQARKAAWLSALTQDFIRRNPSLADTLAFQEMGTARTMRRYLRTPEGAVYGFEQSPDQIGRFRPGARTAIPGLYLSSAFASPGGGFTGAIMAGMAAAKAVRADRR